MFYDVLLEAFPKRVFLAVEAIGHSELLEPLVALVAVEEKVRWEYELLDLLFARCQVKHDCAPDVLGDLLWVVFWVAGDGYHGIGPVAVLVEAFLHVEVVVTLNRLAAYVLGAYGILGVEGTVQRSQALLSVEHEVARFSRNAVGALERAILQLEVTAALELHERAHRVSLREARDDVHDALVVPGSVALKFWQLKLAPVNLPQKVGEERVV